MQTVFTVLFLGALSVVVAAEATMAQQRGAEVQLCSVKLKDKEIKLTGRLKGPLQINAGASHGSFDVESVSPCGVDYLEVEKQSLPASCIDGASFEATGKLYFDMSEDLGLLVAAISCR